MKIVYNPNDGAPIRDFIFQGNKIDAHYPDGYSTPDGKISNGLMQYEDDVADLLTSTFVFLELLEVEAAKKILERSKTETFDCDFPGCTFVATKKIALLGHQRSHKKFSETTEKPVIDPSEIPVASSKKTASVFEQEGRIGIDGEKSDIPNGADKDGIVWVGEGVKVENNSVKQFGATRQGGKAHFQG